jgi:hypothetical protein
MKVQLSTVQKCGEFRRGDITSSSQEAIVRVLWADAGLGGVAMGLSAIPARAYRSARS